VAAFSHVTKAAMADALVGSIALGQGPAHHPLEATIWTCSNVCMCASIISILTPWRVEERLHVIMEAFQCAATTSDLLECLSLLQEVFCNDSRVIDIPARMVAAVNTTMSVALDRKNILPTDVWTPAVAQAYASVLQAARTTAAVTS
jgi:hypothetical protein